MKIKIITSVFLILFISSCSVSFNSNNEEKKELEDKISKLESGEVLFEKQQICLGYKSEVQNDILWKKNSIGDEFKLKEIFYSPIDNKCYVVYNTWWIYEFAYYLYEYWNHFPQTSAPIKMAEHLENFDTTFTYNDFDNYILELKWQ